MGRVESARLLVEPVLDGPLLVGRVLTALWVVPVLPARFVLQMPVGFRLLQGRLWPTPTRFLSPVIVDQARDSSFWLSYRLRIAWVFVALELEGSFTHHHSINAD